MAKLGKLPEPATSSSPFQIVLTALSARVNSETESLPPTASLNKIRSGSIQKTEPGEVFRPFVLFVRPEPSAAIVQRSPPWFPSSLMMPSIKAIDLPSGDQRGTATCNVDL